MQSSQLMDLQKSVSLYILLSQSTTSHERSRRSYSGFSALQWKISQAPSSSPAFYWQLDPLVSFVPRLFSHSCPVTFFSVLTLGLTVRYTPNYPDELPDLELEVIQGELEESGLEEMRGELKTIVSARKAECMPARSSCFIGILT